ncbi:COX15/CtaA family protein [Blastopirellula sp. J2-11]|uniref:COX15/CtaA family protein n=1 Tax=Blastopirellula sp. J2-11 TaxID=2943192 RepID=UPI0021C73FD5|nr:COX15/CtaA family protein [Blastopirellula sp. J2-11]UUO08052.1 COX15/CtaA family protein [Blastopirellula sp. J2-11]
MALLLVYTTFPLIWVGGLVTTKKAGMAVPDWPNTYGYNLFLYPWTEWIAGPFDLFVEHGHRLLGSVVGMVAIALVIVVSLCDKRRWMLTLSIIALIAVIAQGILGGARVIQDEVLLARIHGCFGPAFFGLTVALAVFTSRRWGGIQPSKVEGSGSLQLLAVTTAALAYVQLLIGSFLRHVPAGGNHGDFRVAVIFHVLVAFLVVAHVIALTTTAWRNHPRAIAVRWWSLTASLIVMVQIGLGVAAWTFKYGWPTFLPGGELIPSFVINAESVAQAGVVTAHVATGSLIVGVTVAIALYSFRYYSPAPASLVSQAVKKSTLQGVTI